MKPSDEKVVRSLHKMIMSWSSYIGRPITADELVIFLNLSPHSDSAKAYMESLKENN